MAKMRTHTAVGDDLLAGVGPRSRLSLLFPVSAETLWFARPSNGLVDALPGLAAFIDWRLARGVRHGFSARDEILRGKDSVGETGA